ncbi:MAG TPA: FAD-binding oxidoreductase [Thermoleophilaceae bacterium]|nr:FAD-binding oxidoreductase [Thermoleophilaceae bacterium]
MAEIARLAGERLGFQPAEIEDGVPLDAVELPPPRIKPPDALARVFTDDTVERAGHTYGKAYRDIVRAFRGRYDNPPDWVAHPRDEADVEAILEWAADARVAVIPYGGGTSVVGGVEARFDGPAVSLDIRALNRVLEVDRVSSAARIQAGVLGPALEDQLREHDLTLRHFPQSFEFSSLGGWIATRAGGHFATLYTHIDELVESVRALTPSGWWESRRLPGSGAGPSPDRMLIGSEGILGVITEAWMRVRPRPRYRASATVHFDSFEQGAEVVRAIAQSGLYPSNCRLLDEAEGKLTGVSEQTMLVLGFESADHPVDAWMSRALEICGRAPSSTESGAGGNWRSAFLAMPYLRDTLIQAGILNDTFETAITWNRLGDLREAVREAVPHATCRFTHVYPDGPAPYFTVVEPARRGSELEQWDEIKGRASEAVLSAGGTITHHHAVGRDHRPWYDRQRPEPFAQGLAALKTALDPGWILNPGTLLSQ